jgi:RNA polymerase sigma factor for flagellar operon FliA
VSGKADLGIRRRSPAGDEAEDELWRLHREGSAAAREKLFSRHLSFARTIASRHFFKRGQGDIEYPDLYQLACAGLLEAIDAYDPDRGVPFRGYAARRIGGSVLDGIARMSEMREQISFRNRVRRERLGSLMTQDEASLASPEAALAALAELAVGLALGFMLEETGMFVPERASDPRPGAYEGLSLKRVVKRIREEVARLPEREQAIIRHHYDEGLPFEQLGALFGISRGRVSQLHRAALALLRKRLHQAGHQAGHFRLEG